MITPEIIFKKLSDRLTAKKSEVEYLTYMDKRFEKWLQYELALSLSDIAIPVVYDNNNNEITYEYQGSREKVCDIATEYTIDGDEGTLRSDLIIAEKPFVLKYADEDNWQISDTSSIKHCKEDYGKTKYHYVELKQMNWVDVNNTKSVISNIVNDMTKYSTQDWRKFRSAYNPSSIITICCVSFWNQGDLSSSKSTSLIESTIKNIQNIVIEQCKKQYTEDCHFLFQKLTDELYLLMLFYKNS